MGISDDLQPITFYVPTSSGEPVEMRVAHSGLRMVLVNRESVGLLDASWRVLGIYFLLGPAADPDRFRAYVGEVGRRNLLLRLKEHASAKDWWSRALIVASASDVGFNSAEIGWLEGRLYDVLNNAVAAEVMNKGRPGDDSIALKDRAVLERYVEPIMAALRAYGASPDTADQKPPPKGKKRAHYRESVKDLIDAGLIKPGTRLHPLRKNLTTAARVLEDGSLDVDGKVFASVSPAAQAVSGKKTEAGWEFWGAPSGDGTFVSLFALRERLRSDQPPAIADTSSSEAPVKSSPDLAHIATAEATSQKRHFRETLKDVIDAGLLWPGAVLRPVRAAHQDTAVVLEDGRLQVGDQTFGTPSPAAQAVTGKSTEAGWEFWAVERDGKQVTLYELREQTRRQLEKESEGAT